MSLKNAAPCLAAVQSSWDQEHMIPSGTVAQEQLFSTIDLNDLNDMTPEMNLPMELMDTTDPGDAFNGEEGDTKKWLTPPADNLTSGQLFQVKQDSALHTPTVETVPDFSELFNIANPVQGEELIADIDVPVVEAPFDSTWNLCDSVVPPNPSISFSLDPLAVCNPFEVEGREAPKMPKKPRKPLRLDIEVANAANVVKVEDVPVAGPLEELDTPAVANFLDQHKGDFDLLGFVCDKDRPVNDPVFKSLLENTGPEMPNVEVEIPGIGKKIEIKPLEDVSLFDEKPLKRGRGRPRLPRTTEIIGPRPRGRPPGSGKRQILASDHSYGGGEASSSNVSEDEVKDIKYRRMRDLNNAASKRCRQKRRQKFDALEHEEQLLRVKNQNLKIKYRKMKELVDELKKRFLNQVANPKPAPATIDLGAILRQENIQF